MTLEDVIRRLREVHRLHPHCRLNLCADALEDLNAPPGGPQLELFGETIAERILTAAERDVWLERFVAIYPKKERIKSAREALLDLKPTETLMQTIWTALQWQAKQRGWQRESGNFAPALDRYIRGRRWTDRPRLEHTADSTLDAVTAIQDFIEEEPWTAPGKPAHASPPPLKKLRS